MGINKVQINRNGQTETIIDLTQDTVTEETLLDGVIAHGSDGEPIIGTFTPKLQNKTITENGTYQADSGYDGLGSVTVEVANGGGSSGSGGGNPLFINSFSLKVTDVSISCDFSTVLQ